MEVPRSPREVADWASGLQHDLAAHLARRESSAHRVITLEATFMRLTALSLKQDALMREALRCVEYGLYRPAHVAAWAALIDFTHEWAGSPARISAFQVARPKWTITNSNDFRLQTDYAFIEGMKAAGLVTNTVMKALHGLLNKRNECAHPEDYAPTINDTLGYVDEALKRIAALQAAA